MGLYCLARLVGASINEPLLRSGRFRDPTARHDVPPEFRS